MANFLVSEIVETEVLFSSTNAEEEHGDSLESEAPQGLMTSLGYAGEEDYGDEEGQEDHGEDYEEQDGGENGDQGQDNEEEENQGEDGQDEGQYEDQEEGHQENDEQEVQEEEEHGEEQDEYQEDGGEDGQEGDEDHENQEEGYEGDEQEHDDGEEDDQGSYEEDQEQEQEYEGGEEDHGGDNDQENEEEGYEGQEQEEHQDEGEEDHGEEEHDDGEHENEQEQEDDQQDDNQDESEEQDDQDEQDHENEHYEEEDAENRDQEEQQNQEPDYEKETDDYEKARKEKIQTVVEFIRPKKVVEKPDELTTKKVLNYIDGSMDIAKGAFKIAAFAQPEFAPVLLALAGVASYVQAFLKLIPDDTPDPVDEELKKLEKGIHELEKKMTAQFADLKSFITEVEFTVEILTEVSTLTKYMRDVLKYRSPQAVQNFREAYERHPPFLLTYTLISLLNQKSTNPLRMVMDAEPVKTKATFDKWENIIKSALGQLLVLEAFGSGLFKNKNPFNRNRMMERSKAVLPVLKRLKKEIGKDGAYWAEMKTFLEKYIPEHSHLGNQTKSEEIAKELEKYLTNDVFHVGVFNDCTEQKDYTYHCPNKKTQMLEVWHTAGCNAFIYRCRKGVELNDIEVIRDQLMKCQNDKLTILYPGWLENVIQKQLLDTKLCRGDGLVFLIDDGKNPYFAVANCPERPDKGPGLWDGVVMHSNITTADDGEDLTRKTLLISLP